MASIVGSEDDRAATSVDDQETPRHVCHCGKSFIRKEHLRRHQASHHADARSYVCHICQRSFNRNDVLRRHVGRHSTAAPPDARRGRACDACFANKTKCNGGDCCSLCTRRKISCTYSRDAQGQVMATLKEGEATESEAMDAPKPASEPNLATQMDFEWPAIVLSGSLEQNTTVPDTGLGGGIPNIPSRFMTLFKALMRAPSKGAEAEKIFQEIDKVVEAAEIETESATENTSTLASVREITAIRQQWRTMDTVRTLSTTHSKLYFKHFHHRWPIIHAPNFNEETDPFVVTASVSMIGAWLEGSEESRDLALTIHDRLTIHLLQKMTVQFEDRQKAFPMPIYKAALLNIIFGLYTGKERLIARVIILRSIFMAVLKEAGLFNEDPAQPVKGFRPYLFSLQEGRKRLAFMMFKIDNYLSILRHQPPLLDRDEIFLKLTNTYALWNAHGVYTFYKREKDEPSDRERQFFAATISNPRPLMSSLLMIEDIQLGICGMQCSVWRYAQFRHRGLTVVPSEKYSQESLRDRLEAWKSQLEKTAAELSIQAKSPNAPDFPLKAYFGAESLDSPDWRDTVSIRISSLIFDTTMLYHLLSLHLCSDLRTLVIVAATKNGPCPLNSVKCASIEDEENRVRLWVSSRDARIALLHSATVVASLTTGLDCHSSLAQLEVRNCTADPITYMTVAASALIAWTYISYVAVTCNCLPETCYSGPALELVGLKEGPELDKWILEGGLAAVDGVSLCQCNTGLLMEKFEASLPSGKRWWEVGKATAPMLWHPPIPI